MREGTTSRVTAADRPYGEFYDFYSVSLETCGSTHVQLCGQNVELFNFFSPLRNLSKTLSIISTLVFERMSVWRQRNDTVRAKPKCLEDKQSHCHFVDHKFHVDNNGQTALAMARTILVLKSGGIRSDSHRALEGQPLRTLVICILYRDR